MTIQFASGDELEAAASRLALALDALELRIDRLVERASAGAIARQEAEALQIDRARLADELDESARRQRELERLAEEASHALGDAIAQVRAAIGQGG